MLRCEMGDLTNKHAPFKVNGGRQFYHDVNLPLFGKNSGNVEKSNTLFNGSYRIFAQTLFESSVDFRVSKWDNRGV